MHWARFSNPVPQAVGDDVRLELGEEPYILDASRLLAPAVLKNMEQPPAVYHFVRNQVWVLKTVDERTAALVAAKAHKGLIGKRSLTASDPFFHHKTLYVAYPGGHIKVEGPPEKARETKKADLKHHILRKAKGTFGARGAKLSGAEGAYAIQVLPVRKEFRGKFSAALFRAPTLEGIEQKLDEAIEKVQVFL
jgi:hypothetical protein